MRRMLALAACTLPFVLGSCKDSTGPEDTMKPTVSILYPVLNSQIKEDTTITVRIEASDAGGLSRVELLIDGLSVMNEKSAPFQYRWNTKGQVGSHTLKANAYDPKGNKGESDMVVVSVVARVVNKVSGYVRNTAGYPVRGVTITLSRVLARSNQMSSVAASRRTRGESIQGSSGIRLERESESNMRVARISKRTLVVDGEPARVMSTRASADDRSASLKDNESNPVEMATGVVVSSSGDTSVATEPSGYFEVVGLASGKYHITLNHPYYAPGSADITLLESTIQKDIVVVALPLPQVKSVSMTDNTHAISVAWVDSTRSTLKGYNVYESHFVWYRAEFSEDETYFHLVLSPYVKSNSSLIAASPHTVMAEDYNARYVSYVLPVNIEGVETAKGDVTPTGYIDLPDKAKELAFFRLSNTMGPIPIPMSTHEVALHMGYYYTNVSQTMVLETWSVGVSTDSVHWTTVGTHGFPTGSIPKFNYGYTKTISLNSFRGKNIYVRTNPTSWPSSYYACPIKNHLVEYSQDGSAL